MDPTVNEEALERALATIEGARSWSPRVVSRLEHQVRAAPDEDLFRLNPLTWASERGVDEYEAVDLFLHSAKAGLVNMDWNVICPCCGKVLRSLRELHGLQAQNTCTVCFRKEQSTIDDYVQVTFTVSPAVRPIRFHHPETLSLDEFCFTYMYEPSARTAGVLAPRDTMRLFKKHLSMFTPGERILVETDAEAGVLSCVDIFGQHSFGLLVQGDPTTNVQHIAVKFTDRGFEVPLPAVDPSEFNVGPISYAGTFYQIRPGPLAIEFEHQASARTALTVIFFPIFGLTADLALPGGGVMPAGFEATIAPMIEFSTAPLTAKRLFATQTFHDLFRADTFGESQGFGVKDVTILFTDLKGSTQLYQREGDLNAYALVREHYGILSHAVSKPARSRHQDDRRRHHGHLQSAGGGGGCRARDAARSPPHEPIRGAWRPDPESWRSSRRGHLGDAQRSGRLLRADREHRSAGPGQRRWRRDAADRGDLQRRRRCRAARRFRLEGGVGACSSARHR